MRRLSGFAAQKDTLKATKGSAFGSVSRKKTTPVAASSHETSVSQSLYQLYIMAKKMSNIFAARTRAYIQKGPMQIGLPRGRAGKFHRRNFNKKTREATVPDSSCYKNMRKTKVIAQNATW